MSARSVEAVVSRAILMHPGEVLSLKQAAHHAGRSSDTLRRWCRQYGIGRQSSPNAPLEVSLLGLEMIMHGDLEALELLRQGRREHAHVRRFLDHLALAG